MIGGRRSRELIKAFLLRLAQAIGVLEVQNFRRSVKVLPSLHCKQDILFEEVMPGNLSEEFWCWAGHCVSDFRACKGLAPVEAHEQLRYGCVALCHHSHHKEIVFIKPLGDSRISSLQVLVS